MTLSRLTLGKVVFFGLASLILVDAVLLVARHEAKQALLFQDPLSFFKPGTTDSTLPAPTGYAENGARLEKDSSLHAPGLVVRYASRTCHWCQQDQPHWDTLAQEALRKHYKILAVTPTAGTEYSSDALHPPHTAQITFVDLQWLATLRLRGTPTTLIAGSHNKLLWGHEGALTDEDVNLAIDALRRAHE